MRAFRLRAQFRAGHSAKENTPGEAKLDLGSLSSMLKAHWKGGAGAESKPEAVRPGQIRSFRIAKLDRSAKKIAIAVDLTQFRRGSHFISWGIASLPLSLASPVCEAF